MSARARRRNPSEMASDEARRKIASNAKTQKRLRDKIQKIALKIQSITTQKILPLDQKKEGLEAELNAAIVRGRILVGCEPEDMFGNTSAQ